jgi:hypothetical protein
VRASRNRRLSGPGQAAAELCGPHAVLLEADYLPCRLREDEALWPLILESEIALSRSPALLDAGANTVHVLRKRGR